MNDEMTEKYQKHYNQLVSGTISDLTLKNISFQANIKLANEIISEQEKTISDLESKVNQGSSEKDDKIASLENTIRTNNETITKLNFEISNLNKLRNDVEIFKGQASNVDVFRKELIKEREMHEQTRLHNEQTKLQYEQKIKELNEEIDLLKAPPKRKKVIKPSVLELVNFSGNNEIEEQPETVKDGGTF